MTALTSEELMAWVERTTAGWRDLIKQHPEALAIPCDVRETTSVAGLLQHIVAVELRFAQRISGIPETEYDQIPSGSAEEIYATHDQAMALVRELLSNPELQWEESIQFSTRSTGALRATRRVLLVHLFMHSIRHYAQLATLARQHQLKLGWPMDYIFMGVQVA